MLPHDAILKLFPIDGRTFDTPDGPVTAHVVNDPARPEAPSGLSDQRPFKLKFSNERTLTLVLSDASLHIDGDAYKERAFAAVERWLRNGGPERIEMFE